MEDNSLNFEVDRLGACRIASPMSGVQFVGEGEHVLYHTDPDKIEAFFLMLAKNRRHLNSPGPATRFILIRPNSNAES